MSEETILNPGLGEYRREHIRPIALEFEAAAGRDAVSQALARKYMRALNAYKAEIYTSPGSPAWNAMEPTAYSSALRNGSVKELEWIDVERAHILAQVGGVLPMGGE